MLTMPFACEFCPQDIGNYSAPAGGDDFGSMGGGGGDFNATAGSAGPGLETGGGDFDFGGATSETGDGGFDFGESADVPSAPTSGAGGDFDFGESADVPSAPTSGAGDGDFDFGESAGVPSAPASGAGGDFDFGESADVPSAPTSGAGDFNVGANTVTEIETETAGFDIGATAQSAVPSKQGWSILLCSCTFPLKFYARAYCYNRMATADTDEKEAEGELGIGSSGTAEVNDC